MRIFIIIICLFISQQCYGLDVTGYKQMVENKDSVDQTKSMAAKLSLTAYFQGVSETMDFARIDNKILLQIQGNNRTICVPPTVQLSSDFLELVTSSEVKDHAGDYKDVAGWEQMSLVLFTYFGMLRTFPCDS